ncbi:MAG TPA: AMP-binding protein [Acidimicrobiia bacterium]|nr:AMP-binding protein [Acidimicrobiia bacterium]
MHRLTENGLTVNAAARAASRARRFRADGWWRTEPVDLVADAARRSPARVAVVDRGRSLTYEQLDVAIDDAVAALDAEGVRGGDAVLVLAGNDVTSVVAIHASVRAGTLTMVAPTSAGSAQIHDIVAATAPAVTLAPDAMLPAVADQNASTRWVPVGSIGNAPSARRTARVPRDPDEPSVVIFTSGTTSRPKGVVHSLNTMLSATRNFVDPPALTAADNIFMISPLASVTGMLQATTVAPWLGAQVTVESRFDDAATFEFLVETAATFFGGPDLLLDRVLDQAQARGVGKVPITSVFLGGSMLDPRILARAEHEYGIVVLRAYGSSEAPVSTASARDEREAVRLGDDGAPLAGVEVRIGSKRDPAECCVAGPHLFLGYVDPDDDADAFDDDWFLTGDLAERRDGRLKITGRIQDIVIRNGLNIPIAEMDGMVGALPGVLQGAGYGVADDATAERLAMAVRLAPGATLGFDAMVDALVAAGAAKWKIPEELVLWDEPFPETASGKVQRSLLEAGGAERPRTVAARLRA